MISTETTAIIRPSAFLLLHLLISLLSSPLGDRGARMEFVAATLRHIQTHIEEVSDQASRPAIHVVLAHLLAHSLHAHLLFFRLHFESCTNGLSRLVNVVGIDLQRVP